jgi:hypothetical protein
MGLFLYITDMKKLFLLSIIISSSFSFSQDYDIYFNKFGNFGYRSYEFPSIGEYNLKEDYIIANSELFFDFLSLMEMEYAQVYADPDFLNEKRMYWGTYFANNAEYFFKRIESLNKRDFKSYTYFIMHSLPLMYTSFSEEYNWIYPFVFRYDDIKYDFVTGESGRFVAAAHSPLEDDIRIIINIDKWEELNNYERIWLLLHEYGHEAFGFEHGFNELMYPLLPTELKDLRPEFFMGLLTDRFDKEYYRTYRTFEDRIHDDEMGYYNKYINIYKGGAANSFGPEGFVSVAYNVLFNGVMSFFNSISEEVEKSENSNNQNKRVYELWTPSYYETYQGVIERYLRQYSAYPLSEEETRKNNDIKNGWWWNTRYEKIWKDLWDFAEVYFLPDNDGYLTLKDIKNIFSPSASPGPGQCLDTFEYNGNIFSLLEVHKRAAERNQRIFSKLEM